MLGDVNGDQTVNIQDIILIINLILAGDYNSLGDLNSDNTVNILDVVILVNFISGSQIPTEVEFSTSDLNSDGILNVLSKYLY